MLDESMLPANQIQSEGKQVKRSRMKSFIIRVLKHLEAL
jgi:hypothetical protein